MKRLQTKIEEIISMFYDHRNDAGKAYVLDEPDLNVSATSKKGVAVRDIFGKARQQQAFLLNCATDMSDIHNYIYKKLDRIIYVKAHGQAIYYADDHAKGIQFLGRLKKRYMEKLSYHVFLEPEFKRYGEMINSSPHHPLESNQSQYDIQKKEDYKSSLQSAIKRFSINEKNEEIDYRIKIIKNMREKGLTQNEIGKYIGVSRGRVSQILLSLDNDNR